MIAWRMTDGVSPDVLGFIPDFISEADPRPAKDQLAENYAHGGGWSPMPGFKYQNGRLVYPGDPPFRPLAVAQLRDETLRFFDCALLMIQQPDGSFEVSRLD